MAAIDKIYGTRKEWTILHNFLMKHRPDYVRYMYEQPQENGPLSNFPKFVDCWLWNNCNLTFVIDALIEQYDEEALKEFRD